MTPSSLKPYPVFLIGLENRHCVVVGGGREAEHKVRGLLDCQATVTIISAELTSQLAVWANEGLVTWVDRAYHPGDLGGAYLVIAERQDSTANAAIWEEARDAGVLVNVMDDVEHCDFVAGSVFRQGDLLLTISTSGAAPALAVRLRERFENEFGHEYAEFLALMQGLRGPMKAHHPKFSERRRRWYQLVDSEILDLLRNGNRPAVYDRILEIVGEDVVREGLPK